VFAYTTVTNIIERPDGVKIAAFFIGAIIVTSLVSRMWRLRELRVTQFVLDDTAEQYIAEESRGAIHIIPNHPDARDAREYFLKEQEEREVNHIPPGEPVLFLEITVSDPSEFASVLYVKGEEIAGYRVLSAQSASVANAIAAFLLYLRDKTGKIPHAYFSWTETEPLLLLLRYVLFGEGDVPRVAEEVLRKAERNPARRPVIHVA
jgi:hypothetical protein